MTIESLKAENRQLREALADLRNRVAIATKARDRAESAREEAERALVFALRHAESDVALGEVLQRMRHTDDATPTRPPLALADLDKLDRDAVEMLAALRASGAESEFLYSDVTAIKFDGFRGRRPSTTADRLARLVRLGMIEVGTSYGQKFYSDTGRQILTTTNATPPARTAPPSA